jgi:hypothetical protein
VTRCSIATSHTCTQTLSIFFLSNIKFKNLRNHPVLARHGGSATWEAEIGRTEAEGQPGQTVRETPSQQNKKAKCAPVIPANQEAVNGRTVVQSCPRGKCKSLPEK